MLRLCTGDILDSKASALVVPVNATGVMGAGLALEAAQRWPQVRASYRLACVRGQVRFEDPLWLPHPEDETRWVVCVVTKWHWWDKSVLADVRTSVRALLRGVKARNVETLALCALGCGLGGLDFAVVRAMLEVEVGELADRVELYEPGANR